MIEMKRAREKTPKDSTSKRGSMNNVMIIIGMIVITAIHLFTHTNTHIQTALLPLATLTERINTHTFEYIMPY